MSAQVEKPPDRRALSRPLLSRSSILILSGILVGMGLRDGLENRLYQLGYFAGAIGIISYFGLELLAQRRQREATRITLQRAATVLNTWLDSETGQLPAKAKPIDEIPAQPTEVPC